MQDNINEIISNSLLVNKDVLRNNIRDIVNQIKKSILNNKEIILEANRIDEKNNNGFMIDFDVVNNIFNNLDRETIMFGDVTLSQKDDELIYGTEVFDYGNVCIISDGNPYVMIEMAIRNVMAGNTMIFANNGFMHGTNNLLIQIIQSVFEGFNVSKTLIQMYICEEYDKLLLNYANIDLVLCIGNRNLQNMILEKSKNRVICSGYENFDLYIEDDINLEFLNKIVNLDLNINVYVKRGALFDYEDSIIVDDVDEAIGQINYIGNRYASSIFTKSSENASKFIKEVKSKIVTVNTSPSIERILDIKQSLLVNEKTIIYPLTFKFDGKREIIKLESEE